MLDEQDIEDRLVAIGEHQPADELSQSAVAAARRRLLDADPTPVASERSSLPWIIGAVLTAGLAALLMWVGTRFTPPRESRIADKQDDIHSIATAGPDEPGPKEPREDDPGRFLASVHGSLHGRFVFTGKVPEMVFEPVTEDAKFCAPAGVKDETLVVNRANRGLANVVVMLFLEPDEKAPSPPESFVCDTSVEMTNQLCRFEPRVCVVNTQQRLVLANGDKIGHNMRVDFFENPPVNPTIAGFDKQEYVIGAGERLPARVSCGLHPWMNGWVVVKDHPYVAVTDNNGYFEIPVAPSGRWTYQVWHEACGYVREVAQNESEPTKWNRGRFEVEIPASGALDLGKLAVASSLFDL